MRLFYISITLLLAWLPEMGAQSQSLSNLRTKQIAVSDSSIQLDTLSIVPGSLRFFSDQVNITDSLYELDDNFLKWKLSPTLDSIRLQYRVFPFSITEALQRRDSSMMFPDEAGEWYLINTYDSYQKGRSLFDYKGIDYNGSYTRGISFGNRQNLVVNSDFNLQMSGRIGNDLELLAAISDNNIPLQPEGNSQQLQDFDRIYIQLKRKNYQLTAGDYEITQPYGYFSRYYKKLQGLTLQNQTRWADSSHLHTTASVAVSRGKFARNLIQPQEGNQGPYRLSGSDGERFLIVLAGTEKVFWDGQLLKRGLEYDYVIDYNQGTIVFTSKRLITKDIRLIVEFEYTTQQYLRSLQAFNTEYKRGRWTLYGNMYSEQDGKNAGEARNLTNEQKLGLQQTGDAQEGVLISGERPANAESGPVRYIKIPSPDGCPETDSIYVLTEPDQVEGAFIVGFTEVGSGNGDYVRLPAQAFGTAYAYSPPDANCQSTGDHVPLIRLVSPKLLQLHTAGFQYQAAKQTSISAEVGLSNFDDNRFSNLDDTDNQGVAFRLNAEHSWLFSQRDSQKTAARLQMHGKYEYLDANFRFLNPFRSPEFIRDWNVLSRTEQMAQEHLADVGLSLFQNDSNAIGYSLTSLLRDSFFEGFKHHLLVEKRWGDWEVSSQSSLLQSQSPDERSWFFRPRLLLTHRFRKLGGIQLGVYGEQEDNRRYVGGTDSLNNQSFRYDLSRAFIASSLTAAWQWKLTFEQRQDYLPQAGKLTKINRGRSWLWSGNWQSKKRQRLSWQLAWRSLIVQDSALSPQQAQNTFLGRVTYDVTLWKGFIRSTTLYDIGSGQEQKFEFVYVEVRPGEEGTHLWIDRNEDGFIQFDEIELPPFPEAANVRRVTQFTNEFVRTDNIQLNQVLYIEPRFIARGQGGWQPFLRKWSAQLSMTQIRKTRDAPVVQPWNPFQLDLPDTALVSVSSTAQGNLFFNRSDPKYDIQLARLENRTRNILTTGFESRIRIENSLRLRWNVGKQFSAILRLAQQQQNSDSEFFSSRDFEIRAFEIEPQLSWQPKLAFRIALSAQIQQAEDQLSDVSSSQQGLTADLNYNQSETTSLRANLSFVSVSFDGVANSPVGFALLNGLQDGRNFLWNIGIDRRLTGNVQLSFSYEGRKTGEAPTVHIGRAQVRALF